MPVAVPVAALGRQDKTLLLAIGADFDGFA
jgi:hypothetical protein